MKAALSHFRLLRGIAVRVVVFNLVLVGLPNLLPAQTLQNRYSFTSDASDSIGGANGTLEGNAYVSNGELYLPGGGNSDNPSGYVSLPNGIVSNDASITVECWVTDNAGSVWAETWCFGDSAAGPGQPPNNGTSYISLIPHSGYDDFRGAFNLTGGDEIDVIDPTGPMPLNVEQYAVVTYDAASTTARLYLNGVQVGVANIPTYLAPANYGDTFNNWLGRDEFGGDPMFAGSIDELRIWNAAVSPLYISVSTVAGPNVLVTNLTPVSVNVAVANTTMLGGLVQQAMVSANFLQATNAPVTAAATNWNSSNPNVLTVNSTGLVTAVSAGNATVSATLGGIVGTSASITVSSTSLGPIVTVGYWQFNDPSNLGLDSSGLGNNLTNATGTPTYSSAGLFGGALYLDGDSTMTTLSGAFPLEVPTNANPYTIAVWEKIENGCPDNGGFIGWGDNDYDEANDFRLNGPNSVDDYWYSNDFIVSDLATNPMDGNWHALAVTWDGTNQTMYVDGVNVGARTPTQAPAIQPMDFIVGKTTADVNFVGWMEDLLIANIALTPADISVYQAGNWSASLSTYPQLPSASPSNTVFAGTTVTLSVAVAGMPPYQYQWQFNGTNISWGTAATLVITNATLTNSGSYDVIVGNTNGTNTSPVLTVTVYLPSTPVFTQEPSPAASTNYLGGFITFTAAVSGTQPLQFQWEHNGAIIPNATASSLTLASLQAGEAGTYTLAVSNSLGSTNSLPAILTVLPPPNPSALNVLTYHNDNARDGANTNEVLLTPANVNVTTFGQLIKYPTDGLIIAQPLYVSGLVIPGQGTHNAVIVATENNSVYAFDADSSAGTNAGLLWHTNLGMSVSSYTGEFGTRYQGNYYGDIQPVVGITGTPVINLASGTLYVNVHTRITSATSTNYYHSIHAINITNGTEQSYSPTIVTNSFPGVGVESTNGIVRFDPMNENQRPGLTLAGGMLYVGYGSYADTDPYHGWVLGFNAANLQQSANEAFNTTPNATIASFGVHAAEGALWMSGDGLCVDSNHNLYFATANGSFTANTNGGDYGDSFMKLSSTNGLALVDYFTPYNQATLSVNDTDLGSGGLMLLPDSVGSAAHPHLLIGCGKDGILRLVDRDNMGHYNANGDNQIVQEVPGAISGAWSTPAFFNNQIYYQGSGGDVMKGFYISNAVITPTPVSRATVNFSAFATGGTPSISANGTNNGIVWAIQSDASVSGGAAVLHAFNATNLALELYNSSQNPSRDNPGPAIIMTTPTVVNGKVFVGAQYYLSVYGNSLFLATPVIAPAGGSFTNSVVVTLSDATPNSTIYYTLDGTAPTTNSLAYDGPFILTSSANVQAIAAQPGAANSGIANVGFVDTSAVGTGSGLHGSYWSNVTSIEFTNASFSLPPTFFRTDPTIDFNWTATPPSGSIGLTNFVVRWIGSVQPEYGETYTFSTDTDSGVRLYVNGQLLINQWVNQPATTWSNSITLVAQERYNIEMDFYNQSGGAVAELSWSSPSTANAIIPQTQLYPFTNPPPTVILTAPTTGSSFTAAASVSLSADADAPYNPLSYVSFYTNGALLGTVSNAPYALTVTGLPAESYTLTATATDGSGLTATSAPVAITVTGASGVPYGLTTNATLGAFLNQNMPGSYSGSIPLLLSATGAYVDTPNRIPSGGLIPYVPNTPLWSDGAGKSRYLALPYSGGLISPARQIGFASTGPWTFPSGTIFVKNFDLVVNATNPAVPVHRLETRLLVRDTNGAVYGVTYKWRPDDSDADLLTNSQTEAILVTNATGVITQNWYFPSPGDCLTCHTTVAGYVLGVNARQLNGSETYPATGVSDNQLRALNRLGLFNPAFDEAAIAGFEQLSSVTNPSAPLVQRARSYLDANCSQCHQPGGTGITFDARYDTPLTNQNIVNIVAAFSLGYDNARVVAPSDIWRSVLYDRMNVVNPTIQMPPLARNLIDTNAVAAIADWINSLGGTPALPPPSLTPSGGTFTGFVSVTAAEPATNETTLYYTLDGSLPTTNSTLYTGPILVTNSGTININAWAPGYVNSVAAAAQFSILPGIFFLSPGDFTNDMFQMTFVGAVGSNYVLQVSTNLQQWTSISTNTPTASPFVLADPNAPAAARFYRVIQQQ
jgi:mono/diheme cytochrome c family protein